MHSRVSKDSGKIVDPSLLTIVDYKEEVLTTNENVGRNVLRWLKRTSRENAGRNSSKKWQPVFAPKKFAYRSAAVLLVVPEAVAAIGQVTPDMLILHPLRPYEPIVTETEEPDAPMDVTLPEIFNSEEDMVDEENEEDEPEALEDEPELLKSRDWSGLSSESQEEDESSDDGEDQNSSDDDSPDLRGRVQIRSGLLFLWLRCFLVLSKTFLLGRGADYWIQDAGLSRFRDHLHQRENRRRLCLPGCVCEKERGRKCACLKGPTGRCDANCGCDQSKCRGKK